MLTFAYTLLVLDIFMIFFANDPIIQSVLESHLEFTLVITFNPLMHNVPKWSDTL